MSGKPAVHGDLCDPVYPRENRYTLPVLINDREALEVVLHGQGAPYAK